MTHQTPTGRAPTGQSPTLTFEGRIEKVGPVLRVQSRWGSHPTGKEIDRFIETHWPTDIDGDPLGEDQHNAVAEGIPVEVTVRIPGWWLRRADSAQRQLDDLAVSLQPPAHRSPEDQDSWIEERARELGAGDVSRRILAELDSPGPTSSELANEPVEAPLDTHEDTHEERKRP